MRNSFSMSLEILTDYFLTLNRVFRYKKKLGMKIGKATRISQPGNTVTAY